MMASPSRVISHVKCKLSLIEVSVPLLLHQMCSSSMCLWQNILHRKDQKVETCEKASMGASVGQAEVVASHFVALHRQSNLKAHHCPPTALCPRNEIESEFIETHQSETPACTSVAA